MTDFDQYPEPVKAAIAGLLRVPGRGHGRSPAVVAATKHIWEGLTPTQKLGYLVALQSQVLGDATVIAGLMRELALSSK